MHSVSEICKVCSFDIRDPVGLDIEGFEGRMIKFLSSFLGGLKSITPVLRGGGGGGGYTD